MNISTNRLIITEFDLSMAEAVHLNSLDANNRRFVPDEVFETVEEATETIKFQIDNYSSCNGPLVYPVLLKDHTYIGYVQAIHLNENEWEIGYHIGGNYTGQGYATEAVSAFLPVIMDQIGIDVITGICLAENIASAKVMQHCGFLKLFEGEGSYQGKQRNICKFVFKTENSGRKGQ